MIIIAHGRKYNGDIRRISQTQRAAEAQQRSTIIIMLLVDQLSSLGPGERQGKFLGFGLMVGNAIGAQEENGRLG